MLSGTQNILATPLGKALAFSALIPIVPAYFQLRVPSPWGLPAPIHLLGIVFGVYEPILMLYQKKMEAITAASHSLKEALMIAKINNGPGVSADTVLSEINQRAGKKYTSIYEAMGDKKAEEIIGEKYQDIKAAYDFANKHSNGKFSSTELLNNGNVFLECITEIENYDNSINAFSDDEKIYTMRMFWKNSLSSTIVAIISSRLSLDIITMGITLSSAFKFIISCPKILQDTRETSSLVPKILLSSSDLFMLWYSIKILKQMPLAQNAAALPFFPSQCHGYINGFVNLFPTSYGPYATTAVGAVALIAISYAVELTCEKVIDHGLKQMGYAEHTSDKERGGRLE
jgi:hypothetical protein